MRISVDPHYAHGDALDVESGAARPKQAPGWVKSRRRAGADPVVYCSLANWPVLKGVFSSSGVAAPLWWVADWTGHPHIPAGAVACQYADPATSGGHYDLSAVSPAWPGMGENGNGEGEGNGDMKVTGFSDDALDAVAAHVWDHYRIKSGSGDLDWEAGTYLADTWGHTSRILAAVAKITDLVTALPSGPAKADAEAIVAELASVLTAGVKSP